MKSLFLGKHVQKNPQHCQEKKSMKKQTTANNIFEEELVSERKGR